MEMKNKNLFYIVIYLILVNGLIQTYIVKNELVPFVSDILVLYLSITNKVNINRIKHAVGSWVIGLFIMLLVGSTIVGLINMMPPYSILWGLRMVARYLLLFMLIYNSFGVRDVYRSKSIIIKFFWINALMVAFQYFVEKKVADFIGGTFMGNNELFMFNLFATFLLSKEYFVGRLSMTRFYLFICIEMFVAMVAEIKIMYFTIPLAIYAVYVFTKRFSFKHIVVLALAFFFLVPAMKATMSLIYDEQYVNNTFDLEFIQEETSKAYNLSDEAADFSFNRSTCVEMTSAIILQNPVHVLFGYGIGSGNTSEKFGTWISSQYSKITSYNWFTSSWLLIEYGWVGYIIWIMIYALIALRFMCIYQKYGDVEIKYWSSLGFISVLFTCVLAWYNNIPYYNAYFIYLYWALCFVGIHERQNRISKMSDVKILQKI